MLGVKCRQESTAGSRYLSRTAVFLHVSRSVHSEPELLRGYQLACVFCVEGSFPSGETTVSPAWHLDSVSLFFFLIGKHGRSDEYVFPVMNRGHSAGFP